MRTIIVLAVLAGLATAQETRHEITSSPNPADSKPNSVQVPESYAITSQFERVVILRFKYQTDLLAGLQEMTVPRAALTLVGAGLLLTAAAVLPLGIYLGRHLP